MLINPFLLAGQDYLIAHQKKRIHEWETSKGDETFDFEKYFDEIVEQWSFDSDNSNLADQDYFVTNDIDINISSLIRNKLIEHNILNESGYINFDYELTSTDISNILDEIGVFSNEEKEKILSLLESCKEEKSSSFEVYSQSIFEYFPENGVGFISSQESIKIWESLKGNGIIDEYGLMLVAPSSDELNAGIDLIPNLTDTQKERVLGLLNQHPELSYSSYQNNYFESDLPSVGIYISEENDAETIVGLTKEEFDYIRIIAVMEYSMFSITQKSIFKTKKKLKAKEKAEKKQSEMEEQAFLAKLEAQYKSENNKKRSENNSKKGV